MTAAGGPAAWLRPGRPAPVNQLISRTPWAAIARRKQTALLRLERQVSQRASHGGPWLPWAHRPRPRECGRRGLGGRQRRRSRPRALCRDLQPLLPRFPKPASPGPQVFALAAFSPSQDGATPQCSQLREIPSRPSLPGSTHAAFHPFIHGDLLNAHPRC